MGLRSLIRKTAIYQRYKANRESKMSDLEWFAKRHKDIFGYKPDFTNPKTFNEKIIHRILFDRNPIYTALADKLKARIYISYMLKDFKEKTTKESNLPINYLENTSADICDFNKAHIHGGGGGKPIDMAK